MEAALERVAGELQAEYPGEWAPDKVFAHIPTADVIMYPDIDRINVMGGSIAIGHPFGATGARVTTTLVNEMKRRDAELGLITVCAAGGLGFAMVVERV